MDLGLRDRVAVVTGASRGIGRATTERLVAEGCRVLLCARDQGELDAAVGELDGRAAALSVDVTDADAPERIVAACLEEFGRLDVLINNAGTARPKPMDQLVDGDWQAALDIHFLAPARLSLACAPVMAGAGWGRLVHVASVSGREPDPLFAPYSAAKAALLNLSTSLSQRYAADGVLSSCAVPGITHTELVAANAEAAAERAGSTSDEVMARLLARTGIAAGRFGRPEEIAAAIVFLASEQAAWISGATLEVDGGTLRSV